MDDRLPEGWGPLLYAAANRPTDSLTDAELFVAILWLVRETHRAFDSPSFALFAAGTSTTADDIAYLRSTWFDAHLIGIAELTQEFVRRYPDVLVTAASWRTSVKASLRR